MTDIYVDADACPVRDEVYRVAERCGLKVLVVSNGSRPILPSRDPNVRMIVVDDQGKVQTFADVYKLDPVVGAAILGKEAKPEAVADDGDPKPKPQKPDSPAPSGFAPGIANP